ncbi:suppressor of presenilin protein 4 [Plakobranchus ocellatus]|uniref:Suppressor of presenilin protein 4 n=1 Tax=Plakobranchus ocellatus TaxID=259542 RepID=A0AAV4D391_9GAST|nr:suppressor of presenilin protein 4 [Plakobranchus ocellatus]
MADTDKSTMKNNIADSKEDSSIITSEKKCQDSMETEEKKENGLKNASNHNGSNGSVTAVGDESEEDRDEPDAMTSAEKNNLVDDLPSPTGNERTMKNSLEDGLNLSQNADADADDEDRLVIDDEFTQKRLLRKRKIDQVLSNGSVAMDSEESGEIKANGLNGTINLNNNFLGVTAQSLDQNDSGANTPTAFDVENEEDEDEDSEQPNVCRDNSSGLISLPIGLAVNDMDTLDRAYEEDKRKKKKTRQEVDPGKYFEAVDSAGTKYACSQCGNIYKWRKSLNKHWKEKHSQDPLVDSPSPPGMLELLKSGKYTQLGSRRIYDNNFLATIKTQKDDTIPNSAPPNIASVPSSNSFSRLASASATSPSNSNNSSSYGQQLAGSSSPTSFLTLKQVQAATASRLAASVASFMPNSMGRFTGQPVFPNMMFPLPHPFQQQQAAVAAAAAAAAVAQQQNGFTSQEESALDLTRDSKPASRVNSPSPPSPQPGPSNGRAYSPEPEDQDQPLDFSKKASTTDSRPPSASKDTVDKRKTENHNRREHNCSRCDFSCTSDTEFANHQATHINKRIVRCNECDLQFRSVDDLNTHFMRTHFRKLNDHKEAIKKIPHGLQQTYHLLNMDLRDIGELGNQELGAADSRSLKCNKCDFEAKWPAELQKHAVSHSEERPYVCMVCGSTYKWKWDLVKHFQKSHPNLPNPYRRNDKRDSPDCSSEEDVEDPELKRARLLMLGIVRGPSRRHAGSSNRPSPNNVENNIPAVAAAAARGSSSVASTSRSGGAQGASASGDDGISVEGIIAATQAGQRVVSSQPNILDDEPATSMERSMAYLRSLPFPGTDPASVNHTSHAAHLAQVVQAAHVAQMAQAAQEMIDRRNRAQRAAQDSVKQRHNATATCSSSSSSNGVSISKKACKEVASPSSSSSKPEDLPYKCTMCNYHARWPSEVTQHMKNHSDSKPYLCPRCDYRSKWKWDVVKHLKRCGGGGINDVIDTTKIRKKESSHSSSHSSTTNGPPNAIVSQQGRVKKTTPQPTPAPAIILPSVDEDGIQGATVVRQPQHIPQNFLSPILPASSDGSIRAGSSATASIDLTMNGNRGSDKETAGIDNNASNSSSPYASGPPTILRQQQAIGLALAPALISPNKTNNATSSSATTSPSQAIAPTNAQSNNSSTNTRYSSEMWTCPHCPFSTASQAELKRHSGLHSEDKPFKCDVCQYSTRWACDLKKHRKSYNHFPANKPMQSPIAAPLSATPASSSLNGSQEKSESVAEEEDIGPSPGRFKCSQCNIYFQTMQQLIEHRTNEHIGRESAQSSPAPGSQQNNADQQGEEIDAARIKHPRKAIKQIQCSKCEFVCKSRQTMEKHMADHEELEISGFHCFYCSAQFRDKDTLLDHLTTHSAFNPGEWETFFMTSEEEDLQLRTLAKSDAKRTGNQGSGEKVLESGANESKEESEIPAPVPVPVSSITSTEERIQKILSEVPKQMSSSSQQKQGQQENKYKCEWCPAQFVSLTAVYKHASQAHPIQLKEQDVGVAVPPVSPVASSTPKSKHNQAAATPSPQMSPKKVYTGEPLEILKQQIADKRNHQLAQKYSEMLQARVAAAATQLPQMMLQVPHINTGVKEEKDEGEVAHFNCDKCNFSTPSKSTFLRHSELHGGAMPSKCWFCDYSVEHMQLLYQHMKISHTRKWKALSQDPKYAEIIYKMTMAFATTPQGSNNNDSPPLQDSNAGINNLMMLGSPNKLPLHMAYQTTFNGIESGNDSDVMDLSSRKSKVSYNANQIASNSDIIYKQRVQYLWNGIQINVSTSNVTVQFKCPHCPLRDESVAKACCHVAMSHPPLARFRCRTCRHTDNDAQAMAEHCKTMHQPQERIVEIFDFKALQVNETDMAQFNVFRAKMFQDLVLANAHSAISSGVESLKELPSPSATSSNKLLTCPFCPFKTATAEDMKLHVPNHSRLARYRCQFCDFSTDIPDIISNHIRVHDPNYTGEVSKNTSQNTKKMELKDNSSPEKAVKLEQNDNSEESIEKEADQTQSNESMFKHFKLNAGRMRYRCSACPYRTTCKSNIIKHKRQHQHNKRYKCSKCSYSAARAVLLKNHMDAHDTPVSDNEGQHNDIFCNPHSPGEDFKSDENDDMDVDEIEEDDACSDDLNEMDAKAIADLEAKDILEAEAAHKAIAAADIKSDSVNCEDKLQTRKQTCPHCPYSSSSGIEFQKHVGFHNTQDHFKCDFCSYSIDRLNLISQHRKLHSDQAGFESNPSASQLLNTSFLLKQQEEGDAAASAESSNDAASFTTKNRPREETEDLSTSDPKNAQTAATSHHTCNLCPYKSSSKKTLDIHISGHGLRKRFLCDFCDWSADHSSVLLQHRKVHDGEPTYSSNLKNDESAFLNTEFDEGASGEFEAKIMDTPVKDGDASPAAAMSPPFKLTVVKKSYPCKACPFKTNSKSSFAAHKGMHESGEEFSCPHCTYQAKNKGLLLQHIRFHQSSPSDALNHASVGNTSDTVKIVDTDMVTPEEKQTESNATLNAKTDAIQGCEPSELKDTTSNNNNNNDKDCERSSEIPTVLPAAAAAVKPTRVYVCQYCEREFEAKHLMIQHEKQHLVGNQ